MNEEVLFRLLGQQARGPAANAQQAAYQQFVGQQPTPPAVIEMVRCRDGVYRAWWEGEDWRLREKVYRA